MLRLVTCGETLAPRLLPCESPESCTIGPIDFLAAWRRRRIHLSLVSLDLVVFLFVVVTSDQQLSLKSCLTLTMKLQSDKRCDPQLSEIMPSIERKLIDIILNVSMAQTLCEFMSTIWQ